LKHRSDLFSGISLTIEKPYQLGDDVLLEEGIEGQVVQINWWSTHLLGIFSSAMNEPPRASFKKHG
jgi:small-conductance mechanosensitive channel